MRGALLRSSNDCRYCLQCATSLRISTRAGLRAPWLEPAVRREHRWIWQQTISIVIEGQRWLSWLNAWNMFEECHIITSFYIIWHHITSCFKLPFLFHLCRTHFFSFFFAQIFSAWFPAETPWNAAVFRCPSWSDHAAVAGPSRRGRHLRCADVHAWGNSVPLKKIWGICSICSGVRLL